MLCMYSIGSENVGIMMNSHPSVLSKYILFPSIAEVMISEKLSGRPIPKSLEQQVTVMMMMMMMMMIMMGGDDDDDDGNFRMMINHDCEENCDINEDLIMMILMLFILIYLSLYTNSIYLSYQKLNDYVDGICYENPSDYTR